MSGIMYGYNAANDRYVPIAVDADGVVQTAGGGGGGGTSQATIEAAINAATDINTIIGHIDGIEGHVDGLESAVALAANQIGFSTTANTPSILTSAGEALAANSNRKQWSIQNLGTNPLYVRFGVSDATTSVFQFCLSPGTSNDDGRGAIYIDNCWRGRVSIAGTSPRCVVSELT